MNGSQFDKLMEVLNAIRTGVGLVIIIMCGKIIFDFFDKKK